MQEQVRSTRRVALGMLLFILIGGPWLGEALAQAKLILTTWRIEPSTVKENEPWTVKLWVGNIGTEMPKKGFTVQVLECDKAYAKCDKTYASQEIKPGDVQLAPGKLPGRELVMPIKQGLGKGEHYILFVVDAKKEVLDTPLRKEVRVPVGFQKF
jgi:hypothetical protein